MKNTEVIRIEKKLKKLSKRELRRLMTRVAKLNAKICMAYERTI